MNEKMIGNKIALARKKLNLSQAQLAASINMSPQSVSKWERGDGLPDILMLHTLANVLGVNINYFCDEEDVISDAAINNEKKNKVSLNQSKDKWHSMNFSDTTIRDIDFKYARFTNSNFQRANLAANTFNFTEFINCDLGSCDFSYSNFKYADFKNCILLSAKFDELFAVHTDFKACNIGDLIVNKATFKNCTFKDIEIKNCTFRNTTFTSCLFRKCQFINCRVDKLTYNFLIANYVDVSKIEVLP